MKFIFFLAAVCLFVPAAILFLRELFPALDLKLLLLAMLIVGSFALMPQFAVIIMLAWSAILTYFYVAAQD